MRATVAMFLASLIGLTFVQPEAQPAVGIVQGSVTAVGGGPLAGVAVELWNGQRVEQRTVTDSRGSFRIERVPSGAYEIRLSLAGYAPLARTLHVSERPVPLLRLEMTPLQAEISRTRREFWHATSDATAAAAAAAPARMMPHFLPSAPPFDTEAYDHIQENGFRRTSIDPVSTFSIDVDTASYANVRRFLNEGRMPPADAVRVEELVNYFRFAYPDADGDAPFSLSIEVAPSPWNPKHRLALIGLQARRIRNERTPPRNLVFLLDVSGSMTPANKLPLVKTAMRMLADTLKPADRVAIVVYAGASGLVLPSTPGDHRATIQQAIAELTPGGSTNGAAGIQLAYDTAARAFIPGGINRVILATDGDFNVGVTSQGELVRLIEQQRERGIFLTVLGVGTGNVKDSTMEKLADKGNGNYAYLDSVQEARRVLIAEAGATLVTVAKDVKIQVEFNPRAVAAYRLVGYENRLLNREDFNDDRKDAGEMGAGHTVTALYELVPPGVPIDGPEVDPLKYQKPLKPTGAAHPAELMTVKVRYKAPDAERSQLVSAAVRDRLGEPGQNLGFAAAVAEFGMLLRNSTFKGEATWESARALATRYRGEDADGYRAEFVRLIDLAAALDTHGLTFTDARR